MKNRRASIAVVGSINMDLVVRCDRLPQPGETVLARESQEICGGKGANQAVAAARAGGQVSMIGRVGDDAFADKLIDNLRHYEVDARAVQATTACGSGVAVVAVEKSGQNSILVVPGANGCLTPDDVRQFESVITESDVLLLQLEVPLETIVESVRIATSTKTRVILDPAPAPRDWPEFLRQINAATGISEAISLICPNETEAAELTGLLVRNLEEAELAARALYSSGISNVVITLASQGALLFDGRQVCHIPPFAIHAVDTTAAGDAFAGALGVRWAETNRLTESLRFANAAGAIAATRPGAQISLPSREEIDAMVATALPNNSPSRTRE
jgi:ribokinase